MGRSGRHGKIVVVTTLVVVFVLMSVYVFLRSMNALNDHILYAFGSSASSFAGHLASGIELDDDEVRWLKEMDFQDAMDSEDSRVLFEEALNQSGESHIKFVYLLSQLSPDEVRYHAEGLPMDGIWLLDVPVVHDQQIDDQLASGSYYDDINRYVVLSDQQKAILSAQKTTYSVMEDQWGRVLTGFAPVYSTSGHFVGMLGVDMYLDQLLGIRKDVLVNLFIAYILVVGTLMAMFLLIYRKYMRIRDQQLYRDPLTSAYNRRYFNEMFEDSLNVRRNLDKYLVLVMFDIDFFKNVNDRYGHDKGDICLKGITDAIIKVLAMPPNILVRYGGEEFLAAMTVSDNKEAADKVRLILQSIRNLDMLGNGTRVTVSAGGAILPYPQIESTNMGFVIKTADDNLYYCKNHGRDQFKMTDYSDNGK